MKPIHKLYAAFSLALLVMGAKAQAANFQVVPTVGSPGVLLRFLGTPAEADPTDPAFKAGFAGFEVRRDGVAIGQSLSNPSAQALLDLRKALYSDTDWAQVVATTNNVLTRSKLPTTSDVPAEWVTAVKAAPALARGMELKDWRAAVLLGKAFLDKTPLAGAHLYQVFGLQASLGALTAFPLANGGPISVNSGAPTVILPPQFWNVTPQLAHHSLNILKASTVPPDGTPDVITVHEFKEKAHLTLYFKMVAPALPSPPPPGVLPDSQYLPFGYNVERAPVDESNPNTPPVATSPTWKLITDSPVEPASAPATVPDVPSPAVLEALKAEITDSAANAKLPGPGDLDAKKTTIALQNWTASRSRASATTFRNVDFDFADRGSDLAPPGSNAPAPADWGPTHRFWYRIKGLNGFGAPGQPSPVIRARPFETYPPMPVRDPTAQKTGPNQVTLNWLPSADLAEGEVPFYKPPAGYRVYRWRDGRPGYPGITTPATGQPGSVPIGPGEIMATVPAGTTNVNDTGQIIGMSAVPLVTGHTYWYRIVSIDDADPPNESVASGAAWAILYDETAPAKPGSVVVKGVPCDQIDRQPTTPTGGTDVPRLGIGGSVLAQTKPPDTRPCPCGYTVAVPAVDPKLNVPAGSSQMGWTPPADPDVVGYLVYRAEALFDTATGCPNRPGDLEFVGQVNGNGFIDTYQPTDPTPVFYGVRAMDKDRNLSDLVLTNPILLTGSQNLPVPNILEAKANPPAVMPGPWSVGVKWEASVPANSFYKYELWRAETQIPSDAALPGGLPSAANLTLVEQGTTGVPATFFPHTFTDNGVAPGPDNMSHDYFYLLVLKDPSGKHPNGLRSKAQYVKVGGDALEPEHPVSAFGWGSTPISVFDLATGKAVNLSWGEFPFSKLSWVKPNMTKGDVLKQLIAFDKGSGDVTGAQREPIDYVVFRSATGPDGNFRQVSPIVRFRFWQDRDVNVDGKYYYQVLAFDPVTKELVGYTDPIMSADTSNLVLIPVTPVDVVFPNVTFLFDLQKGQSKTWNVILDPSTQQDFAATGNGKITLAVGRTENGLTTVPGQRTDLIPMNLNLNIGTGAATHTLTVTAVDGPAKGKITRSATTLIPIIINIGDLVKNIRVIKIGVRIPIPGPNNTLLDFIKGDLNNDGVVNVGDAVKELQYIVSLIQLDQIYDASADVNGDGKVNIADAILMLQFAVGLIK